MIKYRLPPEGHFIFSCLVAGLGLFSLMRLGLMLNNISFTDDIPATALFRSFAIGVRFDLLVMSFILAPFCVWMMMPRIGWQYSKTRLQIVSWMMGFFFCIIVLVSLAEWEFYKQFQQRLNRLAIQYLAEDPKTVISMIWHGFPVLPYLTGWIVIVTLMVFATSKALKRFDMPRPFVWSDYCSKIPAYLVVILILILGARGGFQQGPPLRWGDAYFSHKPFANHLALNGVFTLSKAFEDHLMGNSSLAWSTPFPKSDALSKTRFLVLQPGDLLLYPEKYPLLRHPGISPSLVNFEPHPQNVVLILLESFSAEFIGALGAKWGVTPEFDKLAFLRIRTCFVLMWAQRPV